MAAEVGTLKLGVWLANFTWTLDLALLRGRKPEESIRSPSFTTWIADNNETADWHIQLYPNGVTRAAKGYLSIYLHSTACQVLDWKSLLVYFSITDEHKQEFQLDVPVENLTMPNGRIGGIEKFLRRDLLTGGSAFFFSHWNQDIKVKIKCCLKMSVGKDGHQWAKPIPPPPPQSMKPTPPPRSTLMDAKRLDNLLHQSGEQDSDSEDYDSSATLMDDFEALLVHGRSDVKLLASGKSFHAHKAVLAARSTVFASQFEQDKIEECTTSIIDMDDLDPEVLKKVMRFVYIGKIVNLDESAHEMLGTANKFALQELKDLCEEAMIKHLNICNACDYLVLAFKHEATRLQAHVTDFYDENCKDIMETPGFKSMTGPNSVAIAAILAKPYLKNKLKQNKS